MKIDTLFSSATNIAYVVVGIVKLGETPLSGISLILLGIASFGFHITPMTQKFRKYQRADIAGMYLAMNMIICEYLMLSGLEAWVVLPSAFVITAVMIFYERVTSNTFIIPVQYIVLSLLALSQGTPVTFMWYFLAGIVFNIPHLLDRFPKYREWTHGLWHLLTAKGFHLL